MGKLIAAYQNEMLKILRKKSIWIIGLIMVAVIALVSVGVFLQTELSGVSYDYDSEILWMEKALQSTKDEIGNKTGSDITDTAEGSELYSNLWRVEYLSAKIDYYKALDEKNIYLYNQYDYRAELLEAVFENAVDIAEYENIIHKYGLEDMLENGYYLYPYSGNYSEEYIAGLREINDKYTKIVAENDFAAYIEIKNAEILADDMYDENEKRIKIENNNLRLDGNITGEYLSHERIIDSLMELTEYKISVETGKDYVSSDFFGYATGEPLMPSKLEEYKKQIALIEYKFESGYYNINEESDKTSVVDSTMFSEIVFSIGMTFMLILLVMLAGSIISVEMSNGSIKVLAVAPIERRKIFAAKCMALFTIAFAGCILVAILDIIAAGFALGFGALMPYVYYGANAAASIPFVLFVLLYALVQLIQLVFYSALALMLSALTKNTSVAIGVSLGVNYIMASVSSVLSYVVDPRWTKYIPTISLSRLVSGVFPEGSLSQMLGNSMNYFGYTKPSIWFCAIYVAVIAFAMLFTARDAFCRRDIK